MGNKTSTLPRSANTNCVPMPVKVPPSWLPSGLADMQQTLIGPCYSGEITINIINNSGYDVYLFQITNTNAATGGFLYPAGTTTGHQVCANATYMYIRLGGRKCDGTFNWLVPDNVIYAKSDNITITTPSDT